MEIVETVSGAVRGVRNEGVVLFAGIPYAAPPVGVLRFRPPAPPRPWLGVRDAFDFGHIAMQEVFVPPIEGPPMSGYMDRDLAPSEDCLVLHVWTPAADSDRRPVMVWIHGGGFSGGAGHGAWTDGAVLAREEDVVIVSLNHRLQAFGHLFLAGFGEEYADSGNVGLLDIVAALEWVRDNIGSFGGDAGNVTVFGQSGGGWKISALLAMPDAQDLFHKAVVQSGSLLRAMTAEDADRATRRILRLLEIPERSVELLTEVPAERIVAATRRMFAPETPATIFTDGTWSWNFDLAPVVDGRSLRCHPFHPHAPTTSAGVPLLIGATRDEIGAETARANVPMPGCVADKAASLGMARDAAQRVIDLYRAESPALSDDDAFAELLSDTLFLMPAVRQAEAKVRQAIDPVYIYLFAWEWARANDRAVHAVDVPFVFGNLGPEVLGTPQDDSTRGLSALMRRCWAAFARTGDPNHAGLPYWEPYSLDRRATMIFDHETRLERDPRAARRRALDGTA